MKHEIMHRSYAPTIGGKAVPEHKLINDLGKDAIHYIGSFSEYNPLAFQKGVVSNSLAIYVLKRTTVSRNQQKPFKLPGFVCKSGVHYHGSDFNNNTGLSFSKQDLLAIANAMDDTDSLQIAVPDSINSHLFQEGIKKVTQ